MKKDSVKIEKKKINTKNLMENLLVIFLILCPIFDILSFIFRNIFNTSISPSTILRPIIPLIVFIDIFIKSKHKLKIFIITAIYGIYAILHLLLFNTANTGFSYSNVVHEMQYVMNYTFTIIILFIYIFAFKDKEKEKLQKGVISAVSIYLASILLSIITKTSSATYMEEGTGIKGWFESGNSISAVLVLAIFVLLSNGNKSYKKIIIGEIIILGIFLCLLIGTRVGLLGFIIALVSFIFAEIVEKLIKNTKINKKIVVGGIFAIIVVLIIVTVIGSNTIERRKHLKEIESNIVDGSTNQEAHITGDLMEIKEKIDNNQIENTYMNEAQKKSILELYDIANKLEISNNDQRMQQLIYNALLVKNQANPLLIIFGNGYMNQYRELVLEMDIPAFLFNFGVLGFLLYLGPFLAIFAYGVYFGIRKIKKIDAEYIMYTLGLGLAFAISVFSGYVFFNMSTVTFIAVICALLINKICTIKKSMNI
ncbi:MAG: O-antigen ligase family protein [Clostridia bacterium]|nr:O-antigen ligase family protein [Clostridia bacterium]